VERKASITQIAIASFIGTAVEWYDFFLYGTAAALIFNRLFFPTFDPLVGTLAAFGTYAVGFAARPLGSVIFGHYGDKLGRKSMLSLTLLLMGVATFCIGLLPTYETLGIWASVLLVLLRMLQGFGVGGEWGGAVLMAVEHAPDGRRGFYGSWPRVGVPAGLLLSTGVFSVMSTLPEEQLLAWGWRIPFLFSLILVGVGLFIRLRIHETPAFSRVKAEGQEARLPVLDAAPPCSLSLNPYHVRLRIHQHADRDRLLVASTAETHLEGHGRRRADRIRRQKGQLSGSTASDEDAGIDGGSGR
jgi:MFS family permease